MYRKLSRCDELRDSVRQIDGYPQRLLDAGGLDGCVRHHAALDQSWPLRRLPVFSHFSYRRSRSALDAQEVRSLTSDSTSTKPTNLSASSANTGENVSVSYRLSAL